MIEIDTKTQDIHLTRGDAPTSEYNRIAVCLPMLDAATGKKEYYKFKDTDKLTMKVFEKKGYTKPEIFKLEWKVSDLNYPEEQVSVEIPLTEELTKKFPKANKKKTYWFDICLNDTTTLLGMKKKGQNKIIVYAEGDED